MGVLVWKALYSVAKCYHPRGHVGMGSTSRRLWMTQVTLWSLLVSVTADTIPHMNGFIHLSFYPSSLVVTRGDQAMGYVNASVVTYTGPGFVGKPLELHMCCTQSSIAGMDSTDHQVQLTNHSIVIFNVTVHGLRLGKTSIRFYVKRHLEATSGPVSSSQRAPQYESSTRDHKSTDGQENPSSHITQEAAETGTKEYSSNTFPTSFLHSMNSTATVNTLNYTADSMGQTDTKTMYTPHIINITQHYSSMQHPFTQVYDNSTHLNHTASQNMNKRLHKRSLSSSSNHMTHLRDLNESSELGVWWLPGEYEIVVRNPPNSLGVYLVYFVLGLVAVNMVGIGGQLDMEEVVYLVKKPLGVTVAFVCRFGVVPAIGLGLVELLQPDKLVSLGVLSLLCSPAEGASNLLVLLLEGDLTFSMVVTVIDNFASVAMLPLWTILFETRIYSSAGNVSIPFREIFIIFGYMTSCLIVGFACSRKLPKLYTKMWLYLPGFTVFTLLMILIVDLYNNAFIFQLVTVKTFFLGVLVVLSGYVFSAALAFICRLPFARMLIITIETGVRTSFIPSLIVYGSFPQPEGDIAKTAPVLCTFLCLLPAFIIVIVHRLMHKYRTRNYTETECSILEDPDSTIDQQVEPLCNGSQEVVDAKETAI